MSFRAESLVLIFIGTCFVWQCSAFGADTNQTAQLFVNASEAAGRKIPDTLCGIFFEVSFTNVQGKANAKCSSRK